jgi:hypothetical protein
LADDKRPDEALDACPLPPDRQPPERDASVDVMNFYDRLFGDWRIVASAVTLAGILLLYGLMLPTPPLIIPVSAPEAWDRAFPEVEYTSREMEFSPRFENLTIYEENLILESDDVLVIENCTFVLRGWVLAKDNANLVLRNCEFYMDERMWRPEDPFNFKRRPLDVLFNDSAVLEVHNSSILAKYSTSIGFTRESRCLIDGSTMEQIFILMDEGSSIQLRGSDALTISVSGDATCDIMGSTVGSITSYSIAERTGDLESETDFVGSRVVLRNSTLTILSLIARNIDVSLDTQMLGYHDHWSSRDYLGGEEVLDVEFHDTNLTGGWSLELVSGSLNVEFIQDLERLVIQNGTSMISNCSLVDLDCLGDSEVEAEDCIFYFLELGDRSNVVVSRSKADLLIVEDFIGTATFDEFLIQETWLDEEIEAYIEGSLTFGENISRSENDWHRGYITRNFEVHTQGEKRALPGVELTLYDKDGVSVWNGRTGIDGVVNFNLTFGRFYQLPESFDWVNNNEDLWNLEATWEGASSNATVGLLVTDTPIVFTFPSTGPPFGMQGFFITALGLSLMAVIVGGYVLYRNRLKN